MAEHLPGRPQRRQPRPRGAAVVPGRLIASISSLPLEESFAKCLVGQNFLRTACSFRHQWKAKKVFGLSTRATTTEQYQRQGRRCASLLGTQNYVFDGPSLSEWKAGNHFMTCSKRHS